MTNAKGRLGLAVLLAVFASNGCAVYTLSEAYEPTETATPLTVTPVETPHFMSVGLLGVPLIPVYVRFTAPEQLELTVKFVNRDAPDFSFAWRPCVSVEGEAPLCARSAKFSFYTGVPGESWEREFGEAESPPLRVTGAELLEHAGQADAAPEHMTVTAQYVFDCRDDCPEVYSLDGASLFEIGGAPVTPARIEMKRRWEHYYEPFMTSIHG